MCLKTRYGTLTERRMIDNLPDGLITVYRAITAKNTGGYKAVYSDYDFFSGLNHNRSCDSEGRACIGGKYEPGFHSFRARTGALRSKIAVRRIVRIVKAQIRKEWITAIGITDGAVIYVTDRVYAPSCRDKSAVLQ